MSDDFDLCRIGAHMFRPGKELGKLPAADLRRLDALEVNGKDFGSEVMLLVQARALRLPVVGGSDAHHWLQLGVRHSALHVETLDLASVQGAIRGGLCGYGAMGCAPLQVKAAKAIKRLSKLLGQRRAA